jgi:hypothetical protein
VLTGVAIGVVCMPEDKPKKWKAVFLAVFAVIANIPDLQFTYQQHRLFYSVSHSLFVNLLLILLLLPLFFRSKEILLSVGGWKSVIGGAFAWLSHLLLDTFYKRGNGLMMFWPFSSAEVSLPIPWFSPVTQIPPPLTADTVHIMLIEFVFYGTLLLIAILLRWLKVFPWTRAKTTQLDQGNPDVQPPM